MSFGVQTAGLCGRCGEEEARVYTQLRGQKPGTLSDDDPRPALRREAPSPTLSSSHFPSALYLVPAWNCCADQQRQRLWQTQRLLHRRRLPSRPSVSRCSAMFSVCSPITTVAAWKTAQRHHQHQQPSQKIWHVNNPLCAIGQQMSSIAISHRLQSCRSQTRRKIAFTSRCFWYLAVAWICGASSSSVSRRMIRLSS